MAQKRHIIQDTSTAARAIALGQVGERLAYEILIQNGFVRVQDLNLENSQSKYADVYAERGGERFVISVKARNKYEWTGRLNGRYKLGQQAGEYASVAEERWQAKAAWVAIAIEVETYSAYFGLLSQLRSKTGIPMTPKAVAHYECLEQNQHHNLDYARFANTYRQLSALNR